MGGLKMTTTVSNNNGKIIIVAALICLFAFAIVNMESVPEVSPSIPEEAISNNPNNPSNAFTNAPKDPTVFDENHAQYLLDEVMKAYTNDEKAWKKTSELMYLHTRNCEKEGVLWNPEELRVGEFKNSPSKVAYFGFAEDAPKNSFYAGPVVIWWREKPGGEIFYAPLFVSTDASYSPWRDNIPYECGLKTCSNPPREVVEVLNSKNIKLIY